MTGLRPWILEAERNYANATHPRPVGPALLIPRTHIDVSLSDLQSNPGRFPRASLADSLSPGFNIRGFQPQDPTATGPQCYTARAEALGPKARRVIAQGEESLRAVPGLHPPTIHSTPRRPTP